MALLHQQPLARLHASAPPAAPRRDLVVLNYLVQGLSLLTPLLVNVIKFRASVYADDLVVFLAPTPQDFSCIREILQLFAGVSGLQTNLDKCQVTPIRCSDEDVAAV